MSPQFVSLIVLVKIDSFAVFFYCGSPLGDELTAGFVDLPGSWGSEVFFLY